MISRTRTRFVHFEHVGMRKNFNYDLDYEGQAASKAPAISGKQKQMDAEDHDDSEEVSSGMKLTQKEDRTSRKKLRNEKDDSGLEGPRKDCAWYEDADFQFLGRK